MMSEGTGQPGTGTGAGTGEPGAGTGASADTGESGAGGGTAEDAAGPARPRYPGITGQPRTGYSAYPEDGPASEDERWAHSTFGPLEDWKDERSGPGTGPHWPRRWRLDQRGRRLAAGALAIALVSALLGGAIGGYVVSRSQDNSTSPGYSLGPIPRAVTGRPAASVAGISARVLPSVVMIRVNGNAGTGSGFVIHGGYIITDNHVVTLDGHAGNASLQVVFENGAIAAGRLVGRDTFSDIAVIKPVGTRHLPALPLGNSAGLDVGDPVLAFGAPLGLAGTVTNGIVSALDRPVQPGAGNGPAAPQVFLEAIQTDAAINPGNSGGPLVNGQGQVVGVNSAFDTLGGSMITGQGGSIGLGFAIPIDQASRVAMQLIRTGHATHSVVGALLNVRYTGAGAQIAASAGGTAPVTAGGPAARAGLRSGDVIVGFAGQAIPNTAALLDAIRSRAPGSQVTLTYLRHGKAHTASLTLGSASS
jgi:putative serine protease PepD